MILICLCSEIALALEQESGLNVIKIEIEKHTTTFETLEVLLTILIEYYSQLSVSKVNFKIGYWIFNIVGITNVIYS